MGRQEKPPTNAIPQNRALSRRFFHHEKTPQFFSHSSNNPFIHSSGFGWVAPLRLGAFAFKSVVFIRAHPRHPR
jgi:hypothetical protein